MDSYVFTFAILGVCLTAFGSALEPEFLVDVHCPLTKDMCRAMCNSYKLQVPKPTVYNWCIIGCHAANRGNRHCKKKCRYADVPTRLTRPAVRYPIFKTTFVQ